MIKKWTSQDKCNRNYSSRNNNKIDVLNQTLSGKYFHKTKLNTFPT